MTEKITKNVYFSIFIVGTVMTVLLRIFEILYEIDPATGFYKSGSVIMPVLNILLVVVAVALLSSVFLKNSLAQNDFTGKSRINGFITMLLAFMFCADAVFKFYIFFVNIDLGTMAIAVTEILTAVYFFILSDQKLSGKTFNLAAPALLPVLWGVVILGVSFMRYTSIANISEYLFDVLKMVFVLLFMYFNARVIGNVIIKNEKKSVVAFGLIAALFCIISTVPRIVANIIKPENTSTFDISDILYIMIAVYIIDLIAEALYKKKEDKPQISQTQIESDNEAPAEQ